HIDLVSTALAEAERADVVRRIWNRDALLWKAEAAHQKIIANSLGWLTVADKMNVVVDDLREFADSIRESGFRQVMLCGMGGSSLCPEVLARTFGPQPGFPQLVVLDSTDPDFIAALRSRINLERCLFVIASKSGTTTEPLVFYKYWFAEVAQRKSNPGDSFVIITDPGAPILDEAREKKFRRVILNQPDIGGRYSALSNFGMAPAALMGLDVSGLLARAQAMAELCGPTSPAGENPGALLGAVMGECARAGRDKLTIVTDRKLATLGLWIEQLVAESTGKEGKGILPVNGESLGGPEDYNDDRVFVSVSIGEPEGEIESGLRVLEAAGYPVVFRTLKDAYDLGAEFFLWEFATALAGWRLGINPFDQPNVQESKDATKRLLETFTDQGALPEQSPLVSDGMLTIYASARARAVLPGNSVLEALRAHLSSARPGDYVAFLNYLEETPAIETALQSIRTYVRNRTRCATTVGYGPRFLHSTGQMHKGGPDTGIFIQITAPDEVDLPIPGEPYTFSILKQAQALGDFEALASRGRRAIRVDLGADAAAGLARLDELIVEALL
ncbi:MAG: bifunctional transaldolase/phosoglucose isomerase, partial [Pyrinomonadaceae bacterium]